MHMSPFIRDRKQAILADWEAVSREFLPRSETADTQVLRAAVSEILDVIADELAGSSRHGPVTDQHAAWQLRNACTLHELSTAYRALRTSVNRLWCEASGSPQADLDELMRFNDAVDKSLTQAIVWYDARLGQAEQDTRQSEQRYRSLCELSPDAILVHDGARWVYANRAAADLIGFASPRDLLGRPVVEFLLPEYHDAGRRRMAEVLEGAAVPPMEYQLRRHEGEVIDVEVVAAPTSWAGAVASQVIVRDVTDRKRAERALLEADRAKNEFLAVLGHELRNPLAPLRTALDLLEQARKQPEMLDVLRPMMERQISHLVRLVDDLLDISRISRGRIELQSAFVDLNVPVRAALEQVRGELLQREHELDLVLADVPLPVHGDMDRLTQVVANLLANAATYTEPGGTIRLSTERRGSEAVVCVQDNGMGIPAGHLDGLFEPFHQIPEHRALTGGGGLGIGLALSHRLVHMHGGTVEAHSEGRGCGSRFTVSLPIAVGQAAAPAVRPLGSAAVSRRVLVVDDNVDAALGLSMLLELHGHVAQAVHDGAAALELMTRFVPEIVLLDLGLPGMDGVEVARRIRALPGGGDVRLIAVTGWGQDEHRQRTREAGFHAHLTKPVDAGELAAVLEGSVQPA